MKITQLDHLVLTVKDISASCDFYSQILGFEVVIFAEDRKALRFGEQKINLHQAGREIDPKAKSPTPGAADLCFITRDPIEGVVKELAIKNIVIIEGPVKRTGALGAITSVYFRDPDGNLIEVSSYGHAG